MKNNLFIWYPKCSTCQKAKKWLVNNKISFQERHIVEEIPNKEELKKWITQSGYPLKKFFNTSGLVYKELNLKEKLSNLSEDEQIDLLAANGMLIKRPLLITSEKVYLGFKEKEWEEILREEDMSGKKN